MSEELLPGWERRALNLAAMMVRGPDGHIRAWSAGMAELYGYASPEAVGRLADDLLATRFAEPTASIEAALRATGRWRGELIHRRRDGATVVVESSWSVLSDENGKVAGTVVFDNDVTHHQAAEHARRRLASIVEGSHDAILAKTLDGVITSWNGGAEEMFGYSADEAVGQSVELLFPPGHANEEFEILERLKRGERVENYETVRRRKDGSDLQVSLSVSPIRDSSGQVIGASKIARDVTEQKRIQSSMERLQSELAHASRMNDMGQMALGIAHELNQPLAAANNYLSGVRRLIEAGDRDRAMIGCTKAAEQLMRSGEVVRRLRDFVKKGDGVRRVESLSNVVEEGCGLALMGPLAEVATTRMTFSPDAPAAMIDKIQIQQVIVNLVRNAIEAMAGGPRRALTVLTAPQSPGFVQVSVGDTGPGLTPGIRKTLFQPFNTTKENGMGVGLSLCRTIIEAHGGKIWADDNPGGGAVFRFTLPTP